MVFRLFFSSIATIIKGINIFLNITGGHRCMRVFELIVHLGARARSVVLFRHLYVHNLLLSEGPSCLIATAFYKVSVRFLFKLSRNLREK